MHGPATKFHFDRCMVIEEVRAIIAYPVAFSDPNNHLTLWAIKHFAENAPPRLIVYRFDIC